MRSNRRGTMLGVAMFLLVIVTVAGAALLAMSTITRIRFVRSSMDVRMMISAETGIEAVRGRFTLIPGIQDDWSALLPTSGWNNVGGPMVINGLSVQAQAKPTGGPEVLQCRLRAIASSGDGRQRAVEYVIQAANFADYALYFGSVNTVPIGSFFKMVGNFYSRGSLNLANRPGIEFFGDVDTSGAVLNYPDLLYNFKKGFSDYVPIVTIPPAAYGFDIMKTAAEATSTVFYANTISIELIGEKYIRTFEYRYTGQGSNYNPNHYEVRTEILDIPDNSVIYIENDMCPPGVDTWGASSNSSNRASNGELGLHGELYYRRVTIACEHDIDILNNVSYRTLLDYPDLRRFTMKKSDAALAYREMLGVVSDTNINFRTIQWTPLPAYADVVDDDTLNPPDVGHYPNQFSLDGVYMGVDKAARTAVGSATDRELWVCGGIINGNYPSTALASEFDRRNYDTDYRLQFTTPPYFLRAYGDTANMVVGTWRTYEL